MNNTDSDFIFVKYCDFKLSGHRRSLMMKKMFKSKKGISPILATLLLIVIAVAAVIVTYAWVMTFTGSTTSQAGSVLTIENIRFYGSQDDDIEIVVRNSGTADAKVVEVYHGTSDSDLQKISPNDITYNPNTQVVSASSSLEIDIEDINWVSGTRYYFRVVTEEGINLPFSEEA
jgi:flagellin-like protein